MPAREPTMIMLIFLVLTAAIVTTTKATNEADYNGFLSTETAIIDTLSEYITELEDKLTVIKSKTLEIKISHDEALRDVEDYVSNPYNALTILKRFATDWHAIHKMASSVLNNTQDISKDNIAARESLKFPSEDDFDEAIGNLLRLQDVYKLETKRLSLGEIDGVKFGSEMTWSDCLEIGRKSDESGDYTIAKFWIETAMEKLPTVTRPTIAAASNNTLDAEETVTETPEIAKARFEVLQALLNAEFHMDNFEAALKIADEMLSLKPQHKGVQKAKATIEKTLRKETRKAKNKRLKKSQKAMMNKPKAIKKSAEAAMIEEMCRESTIMAPFRAASEGLESSTQRKCYLESGNLRELLLQPTKVEILSVDPYIAMQHDVLNGKQINDLKNLIEESNNDNGNNYDGSDSDDNDDGDSDGDIDDMPPHYEFTKLAQQKLRRLNEKLAHQTGHSSLRFDAWQPQWHSFDNEALLAEIDTATTLTTVKQRNILANVMLGLEASKLGGSLVFPQLELSLKVPQGALLYWSNLNEFQEVDYRIKHYVCPVIAGSQIAAVTSIRRI